MEKNKTGKYLKYAIGEIVLVVIGILIALSINNWNEHRKKDKFEIEILQELLSTLLSEVNFQNNQINWIEASISSAKIIIEHLNNNISSNDSLDSHFGAISRKFNGLTRDQAYQKAKTYGLDFIKNESLKRELSWTYETNTNYLIRLSENYNLFKNISVEPIITELFISSGYNFERYFEVLTPMDYLRLKGNEKYKNILRRIIAKNEEFLGFLKRRYHRIENLIPLIEEEIESRKQ